MSSNDKQEFIKVLVADDDERVLDCYREAFVDNGDSEQSRELKNLAAELFDTGAHTADAPKFNIVLCNQGNDAIKMAEAAHKDGQPFDVVILDVRMPPGIDGVEAGSQIRRLDPDVEIVFVTAFSDVPFEELQARVPPPMHLHYFNKPLSFSQLADDVASMVRTA